MKVSEVDALEALLAIKKIIVALEKEHHSISNECHTAFIAVDTLREKIKSLPK